MYKIINTDALTWLKDSSKVNCIFADPPDNLGLSYDGCSDKLSNDDYCHFLEGVIGGAITMSRCFWISYYYKHDFDVKRIVAKYLSGKNYFQVIWRFTFGQYRDNGFANGYRPILCIYDKDYQFNYNAIKIPSKRQEMGDSRAAGLRVPDDVWDYPRVVGNSPERCAWHPTQHPISLCSRIALLSNTSVVDLFAGTGAMLKACIRNNISCTAIERSKYYCDQIFRDTAYANVNY